MSTEKKNTAGGEAPANATTATPDTAVATHEKQPAEQNQEVPSPKNTPAKGSSNPIDRFDPVRERCVRMFGSDTRFLEEATFLLALVNNTPALQECVPATIAGVLLNIASTSLSLNPVLKLCYVIPRNVKIKTPGKPDRWEKRAMVEPSYMGLMKLATDSGAVRNFEVHEVYKGDEFEFDIVQKRPRVHKPYWTVGHERGQMIGVYGFAVLADGTMIPEHMGADELKKIQSKSDNASGAVYTDWQGEMARKSLVKRLQKYIPRTDKSLAFLEAVELDNAGYDMARNTPLAPAQLKPHEEEVEALKQQALEAFKVYAGPDKATIKEKMTAEATSGRQNPAFWKEVLFMLTGKEQGE